MAHAFLAGPSVSSTGPFIDFPVLPLRPGRMASASYDFLGTVSRPDLVPSSTFVLKPVTTTVFVDGDGCETSAATAGESVPPAAKVSLGQAMTPEDSNCISCPPANVEQADLVEVPRSATGSVNALSGSWAAAKVADSASAADNHTEGATDLSALHGNDPSNANMVLVSHGFAQAGPDDLMDFDPDAAFEEIKRNAGGWAGLEARVAEMQEQATRDGFGLDKWAEVRQEYALPQEDVPWWWLVPKLRQEILDLLAHSSDKAKAGNVPLLAVQEGSTTSEPHNPASHGSQDLQLATVAQAGFHFDLAGLKALKTFVLMLGGTCSKLFGLALMGYLAFQAVQANATRASRQRQQQMHQQQMQRPPQQQPQLVPQSAYREKHSR